MANATEWGVEKVLLDTRPDVVVVVHPVALIRFFIHGYYFSDVLVAHVKPSVAQYQG